MTADCNSLTRCEQVREILRHDCQYDLTHAGEFLESVFLEGISPWEITSHIVLLAFAMELKLESEKYSIDSDIMRSTHAGLIVKKSREWVDSGLMDEAVFLNNTAGLLTMTNHEPGMKGLAERDETIEMVLQSHPYYDDEGTYLQGTLAISRFPHETNFEEQDGA